MGKTCTGIDLYLTYVETLIGIGVGDGKVKHDQFTQYIQNLEQLRKRMEISASDGLSKS